MSAPPIPARCAHRPTTGGGLVIPYVSVVAPQGGGHPVTDTLLGEVHGSRAAHCIRTGLCQVCAQPLERPFIILTTARLLTEQWSSEAPLHPECARYSRLACPMLAGKMPTYRQRNRAEGRPCPDPGCDCGGWVPVDPDAVSKGGQPAELWVEVWLNDYGIAILPNRTINGVSWLGITPLRIRALPRPDPPAPTDRELADRLAAALAAPGPGPDDQDPATRVRLGVDVASDGGTELVVARGARDQVTVEHAPGGAQNDDPADTTAGRR